MLPRLAAGHTFLAFAFPLVHLTHLWMVSEGGSGGDDVLPEECLAARPASPVPTSASVPIEVSILVKCLLLSRISRVLAPGVYNTMTQVPRTS